MTESAKQSWTINGLLAVIVVLLAGFYIKNQTATAHAAGGGWDTDGVVAGTTTDLERLVVVDTKKQNIMIYKTAQGRSLRLVGARSYKYDVEIEDSAGTPIEQGNGRTFKEVYDLYNARPK
jgi:hypothetical protein